MIIGELTKTKDTLYNNIQTDRISGDSLNPFKENVYTTLILISVGY